MTLAEILAHGGTVLVAGHPLEERLTPRQLRFLFATGAFAAGKAAAKAVIGARGRDAFLRTSV